LYSDPICFFCTFTLIVPLRGDDYNGGMSAYPIPEGASVEPSTPEFNLANHFLIAMPAMADERFSGTVIYVCEHNARGALGVVINRPTDLTLQTLFERVDLKLEIAPLASEPVFFGGPVQVDRGFVLHDQPSAGYSSTLMMGDGLALTTSKDVLEAVADGTGPSRMLVTLGYSGWGAGQLEQEISLNAWLTVAADRAVIFEVPYTERFAAALHLLGVDPAMLSSQIGHA